MGPSFFRMPRHRKGCVYCTAEARRSVAPRHCRRTRPPRHQELERQALERGLGQECDGTPRLPDNRGRVMTHPRDAKGRFVRRTAPAPLPPHVIFPSGAPCRRSAGCCSDATAPAVRGLAPTAIEQRVSRRHTRGRWDGLLADDPCERPDAHLSVTARQRAQIWWNFLSRQRFAGWVLLAADNHVNNIAQKTRTLLNPIRKNGSRLATPELGYPRHCSFRSSRARWPDRLRRVAVCALARAGLVLWPCHSLCICPRPAPALRLAFDGALPNSATSTGKMCGSTSARRTMMVSAGWRDR
jgi:hypothetical protein